MIKRGKIPLFSLSFKTFDESQLLSVCRYVSLCMSACILITHLARKWSFYPFAVPFSLSPCPSYADWFICLSVENVLLPAAAAAARAWATKRQLISIFLLLPHLFLSFVPTLMKLDDRMDQPNDWTQLQKKIFSTAAWADRVDEAPKAKWTEWERWRIDLPEQSME